jgi:hypothetical protein
LDQLLFYFLRHLTDSRQSVDIKSMLDEAKANLQDWNSGLQQVRRVIYMPNSFSDHVSAQN